MFGYVITNPESLPKDRQDRFRALYCGLCKTLRTRHGLAGSATLSYDLTFLALLLNALYEPGEAAGRERCPAHPAKRHDYALSPVMDYVADMNVALAYHKCRDDWADDRNLISAGEGALLKKAYSAVRARYPERCDCIEAWLDEIRRLERGGVMQIDPPVNATGQMLGRLFVWPERSDWADELMICRMSMMMPVADATEAFERLPVVLDADILRNVLYSGLWSRYAYLQKVRNANHKGDK